jgi:hypothetical protein
MSVQSGHLSLVQPAGGRHLGSAPDEASPIPPAPPAEVLEQVDAAWLRVSELEAAGRELHFTKDSLTGRIVVEVRTLDGEVVRRIPPSEALDIMTGAATAA